MSTKTKTKPVAGFDPAVPLERIHQHPKNPRRNATASEDLVASVKAQGLMQALVLAPHPDIDGEYVLIAGHRRRDALVQAGAKTAKAEIRVDLVTDVQQIEAMLIENSGRADLTAIEEAEAYEQLQLFNLKAADIARAVGQSRQRVASRIKLLTLDPTSRTKVHDGQVTIDDALQLVDLPKAVREELEPKLGTTNFRMDLTIQQERIRKADRFKDHLKVVTELGILAYSDDAVDAWQLHRDGVVKYYAPLNATDATLLTYVNEHADCLRWLHLKDGSGTSSMGFACADPDSHVHDAPGQGTPSTLTAEQRAEQAGREARYAEQRAEAAAKAERLDAAARLRFQSMTEANPAAVLRSMLPLMIWSIENIELGEFNEHLKIDTGSHIYQTDAPYWDTLSAALDKASDEDVLRAVVAIAAGELRLRSEDGDENPLIGRAFDGLHKIGHQFSDVDTEQHRAATGDQAEGGDDE